MNSLFNGTVVVQRGCHLQVVRQASPACYCQTHSSTYNPQLSFLCADRRSALSLPQSHRWEQVIRNWGQRIRAIKRNTRFASRQSVLLSMRREFRSINFVQANDVSECKPPVEVNKPYEKLGRHANGLQILLFLRYTSIIWLPLSFRPPYDFSTLVKRFVLNRLLNSFSRLPPLYPNNYASIYSTNKMKKHGPLPAPQEPRSRT